MSLLHLALGCALLAAPNAASADAPFRELDFAAACSAARAESKLVFVDFFTTWCGPCKQLDATTWKDERVVAWLAERCIAIKVDAEAEAELAQRFGVRAYPTLLFATADGTERGRIVGYRDAQGFLSAAADALDGIQPSQRIAEKLASSPDDVDLRNELGDALAQEGRHAEALREYLWCYDVGMPNARGYGGVRNSFLLSSIVELGQVHPPALAALRERAAAARSALLAGTGTFQQAMDFSSIQGALHEQGDVLALWDELGTRELLTEQVRIAMADEIIDLFLARERYSDAVLAIGDPLQRFANRVRMLDDSPDPSDASLAQYLRKNALAEGAKIYRALLGATDERAPALADAVLAFDATPDTFGELCEAALSVRRAEIAAELEARGLAALDDAGDAALKKTCERLRKRAERKARAQEKAEAAETDAPRPPAER